MWIPVTTALHTTEHSVLVALLPHKLFCGFSQGSEVPHAYTQSGTVSCHLIPVPLSVLPYPPAPSLEQQWHSGNCRELADCREPQVQLNLQMGNCGVEEEDAESWGSHILADV